MKASSLPLKFLSYIALGIAVLDLGYLNYKMFFSGTNRPQTDQGTQFNTASADSQSSANKTTVGQPVLDVIKEATAALTLQVEALSSEEQVNVVPAQTVTVAQTVKEYYIPLGTGSTNSQEWVDLPGVEAYIVPANYGTIKEFYFEANIWIPNGTGQVYARLINVTDNNPLIESQVYREGTRAGIISSGKIPVPSVTKLYRVQLKSTLGTEVKLDNARMKIYL